MKTKVVASVPEGYGLEKAKEYFRVGLLWSVFNCEEIGVGLYKIGNSKGWSSNYHMRIKNGRIQITREN